MKMYRYFSDFCKKYCTLEHREKLSVCCFQTDQEDIVIYYLVIDGPSKYNSAIFNGISMSYGQYRHETYHHSLVDPTINPRISINEFLDLDVNSKEYDVRTIVSYYSLLVILISCFIPKYNNALSHVIKYKEISIQNKVALDRTFYKKYIQILKAMFYDKR